MALLRPLLRRSRSFVSIMNHTGYRCFGIDMKHGYSLDDYMSDDEFREASRQMTESIIEYRNNLKANKYSISPDNESYDLITKQFEEHFEDEFPKTAGDMQSLMKDVNDVIIPNMVHWDSPNFYGL